MRHILKTIPILLLISWFPQGHSRNLFHEVADDYQRFYSPEPLLYQLLAFSSGGIMANTDFDLMTEQYWQSQIRNSFTNHLSHAVDSYADFTQYPIAIPVYLGIMWIGNPAFSEWANHSLRTLLLAGPAQAVLSDALGGGRPSTGEPQWHLFKHHRAVSGHAFYGAIPLLNFAMQTDQPVLKWLAIGTSVLPGLARFNDDKHYFSQAFLGWWLAVSATHTVWQIEPVRKKPYFKSLELLPLQNGVLIGLKSYF